MALGLFVTGTDTAVGKSLVCASFISILRQQGIDAVGFKPVVTGAVAGGWQDAQALYDASDRCEPLEKLCPLRFSQPLAPTLAAQAEGRQIDLSLARSALSELCSSHQAVVIEGIGGVLVPLDSETLLLDFAGQLGFPMLVVCRAGLGTINHTLLSVREIQRAGLPLAGLLLNVTHPADAALLEGARCEIQRLSGQRVLAALPHLPTTHQVVHAIAALRQQVNVKALLGPPRSV